MQSRSPNFQKEIAHHFTRMDGGIFRHLKTNCFEMLMIDGGPFYSTIDSRVVDLPPFLMSPQLLKYWDDKSSTLKLWVGWPNREMLKLFDESKFVLPSEYMWEKFYKSFLLNNAMCRHLPPSLPPVEYPLEYTDVGAISMTSTSYTTLRGELGQNVDAGIRLCFIADKDRTQFYRSHWSYKGKYE